MAKQTFTTGQVLTAAQMTSLQQTAMGGGSTTAKTASYVLVAADAGTVVQMNSASATTITVNTALFAAGDTVQIQNVGAGVCTVTAGTATVSTSSTLALKQYDAGSLYFNTTSAALFFASDAADSTSPLTTKGDLYGFSTLDARIPIGTNNQVLTADSSQALGLKWATPSSGGKVLQVIQNTSTTLVTTTSKAVWIQQAITPSSASSRVLIIVAATVAYTPNTNAIASGDIRDVTNGTNLILFDAGVQSSTAVTSNFSQNFIHSPATTSSITYALRMGTGSGGTTSVNSASNAYTIILMEIGA